MLSRTVTSIKVTNNTVQSTSARGIGTDTGAAVYATQEELYPFGIALGVGRFSPSATAVPVLYRLHCATLTQSTGVEFTGAVPE